MQRAPASDEDGPRGTAFVHVAAEALDAPIDPGIMSSDLEPAGVRAQPPPRRWTSPARASAS